MRHLIRHTILLLLSACFSQAALSHEAGITDTGIEVSRSSLTLTYTTPVALLSTLELDPSLSPDEARSQAVLAGLMIRNRTATCVPVLTGQQTLDTIDSMQFEFRFNCGGPITLLHIGYSLFFDQNDSHENIVRISLLGRFRDITLTDQEREHTIDVKGMVMQIAAARQIAQSGASASASASAFEKPFGTRFFPVGLKHILFGFDHVLFLLCLVLLPMSPLATLTMITSFTIAHSVTLSLSVLDIVTLPPRFVEAIIALSIVYVSARTVMILRTSDEVAVTKAQRWERLSSSFLFGLIHGFGFSYLLKEIGLGDQVFASLLFFNLGVEAGQLIILAFLLPLIWLLARRFPSWRWARWTSVLTGLIGLFWLAERVVTA